MKILFAVSNEKISESIIKKYESIYKEIVSSKNVYYFNAILKELQKDKSYDRVVISEDLEPFTNKNYDITDNFIFEKLDKISDEAVDHSGEDIPIILITSDRRTKGEAILNKLFGIGIYSALIGQDRTVQQLCELINKPRTKKEAKSYYRIDTNETNYTSESEDNVSELEIQNILAHYKRLGKNEEKYVESFDSIANQYTDTQLKVIIKFLPIGVKAVLEEKSPKYQQISTFAGETANLKKQKPYASSQFNPKTNKPRSSTNAVLDNGIKIESIGNGDSAKRLSRPVIIPQTLSTNNVRKIQKSNITKQATTSTQPQRPMQNTEKIQQPQRSTQKTENIQQLQRPTQSIQQNIEQKNIQKTQQSVQNNIQPKAVHEIPNVQPKAKQSVPNNDNVDEVINELESKINVNERVENINMEELQQPKRGRGRPRKVLTPEEILKMQEPKRGRGRPRKTPIPEETNNKEDVALPGFEEKEDITLPYTEEPATVLPQAEEPEVMLPQVEEQEIMLPQVEEPEETYIPQSNNQQEKTNYEYEDDNELNFEDDDEFSFEDNGAINFYDDNNQDVQDKNDTEDLLPGFEEDNNEEEISYNEPSNIIEEDDELIFDEPTAANDDNELIFDEPVAANDEDDELLFNEPVAANDDNELLYNEPIQNYDGKDLLKDINEDDTNNFINSRPQNISNSYNNYNTVYKNDSYEQETRAPKRYDTPSNVDLSNLLSANKKLVAFVGTSKNGTSFLVNNIANMTSSQGIKTAILDLTKNRNSYYIYTKNEENLRKTATECINKLIIGTAQGIPANRNLDVYTCLPGENNDSINQYDKILETLLNQYSLVLLDCDFSTEYEYLRQSQEIYLVQSMDVLTIQPLTAYLRDLKAKNILEQEKLRIVINKYTKVRSVTEKTIIGGMAFYNDPSMSFMTELFNREKIRYTIIPFDIQTYSKYLEGLINCNISINGYSKEFINSLGKLTNMVYPLVNNTNNGSFKQNKDNNPKYNNQKYNKYAVNNNAFSNNMNNTLDKMKNNY